MSDEDEVGPSVAEMPVAEAGSLQESMNKKAEVYQRLRRSKGRSGSKGIFRSLLKGRFGMLIFFAVGALSLNWLFKNFFGGGSDSRGGSSGSDADFSAQKLSKGKLRRLPVCRDGIVVITDAAYGSARETALLLADQGMYVLAAVRTKVELKSFVYEERKGLELIVADPIEPNEVAKLFYRVKQLQIDLDRKFFGLIVNTADSVLDLDSVSSLRDKYQLEQNKREETAALEQRPSSRSKRKQDKIDTRNATAADLSQDDIVNAASLVDVPSLDDGYKTILKSSMRIAQAALEMFSEAESTFRADLKASEEAMSTKYQECMRQSGSGLDDDPSGECYNSLQAEKERLAMSIKNKNMKMTARDTPAAKEDFGAETCAAGATGRILFMTYNFEGGGRGEDRNPSREASWTDGDARRRQSPQESREEQAKEGPRPCDPSAGPHNDGAQRILLPPRLRYALLNQGGHGLLHRSAAQYCDEKLYQRWFHSLAGSHRKPAHRDHPPAGARRAGVMVSPPSFSGNDCGDHGDGHDEVDDEMEV
jgi:hypothetical protein